MYRIKYEYNESGKINQTLLGVEIEKFHDDYEKLFNAYEPVIILTENKSHITKLRHSSERVCRFCKKNMGR